MLNFSLLAALILVSLFFEMLVLLKFKLLYLSLNFSLVSINGKLIIPFTLALLGNFLKNCDKSGNFYWKSIDLSNPLLVLRFFILDMLAVPFPLIIILRVFSSRVWLKAGIFGSPRGLMLLI